MSTTIDPLFASDAAQLSTLREQRFAATLDRVFAAHPYYRRKFAERGLSRGDVRGLADLGKLSITTKADYVAEPDAFVLGAAGAADDAETIVWDIMYTTGSSGKPTLFVSTAYDFVNILALNRNMMRLRGVTTADTILNLFPLTRYPHGAFARAMNAAAAMNIPIVAALPGHANERQPEIGSRLDEVVAIAERSRATILWGVPTFIRKMAARAEELGAKLPWYGSSLSPAKALATRRARILRTGCGASVRRRRSSAFPMVRPKCRAAWSSARRAPAITIPRLINFCSRQSTRRPMRP